MITLGTFLRRSRLKKKLSLFEVEKATRIKREFILAIEKEDWDKLPEYPVVHGFVRNLSAFLGLDLKKTLAFLRRDYPPTNLMINPKPDLKRNFVFGPRLAFFLGVAVILSFIFGYLYYQYSMFKAPPKIIVNSPTEEQIITQPFLRVFGKVDKGATIRVNNQPAEIDEDGNFETEIEINKDSREVEVKASSRNGKETRVVRKIKVELE